MVGTYQISTGKLFPFVGEREVAGWKVSFCRCPDCGEEMSTYAVQQHECERTEPAIEELAW